MVEWYRKNIFDKEILKNIYRIMEKEKIKNMEEIENFKQKVLSTY